MTLPVRYSPSGAVIATFDAGARLRLTETNSVMGGSLAIPVAVDSTSVIASDGFGGTGAIVLSVLLPKEKNLYRAELSLDVVNTSTNVEAQVVLYLDTSIDGGTTWVNRAKCMHEINALNAAGATTIESRQMQINLVLIAGESLGVDDSVPTASLKMRARASLPVGTAGAVLVNSAASSGGTPITNLDGTIHFEFEECLA